MKDIVIVDNTIASFALQIDNGIYVPSFYGEKKDRELDTITSFLESIAFVEDVRPLIKSFSGIQKLFKEYKLK